MSVQLPFDDHGWHANVALNNETVARARAHKIAVPRQAADARRMTRKVECALLGVNIPYLRQTLKKLHSRSKIYYASFRVKEWNEILLHGVNYICLINRVRS